MKVYINILRARFPITLTETVVARDRAGDSAPEFGCGPRDQGDCGLGDLWSRGPKTRITNWVMSYGMQCSKGNVMAWDAGPLNSSGL